MASYTYEFFWSKQVALWAIDIIKFKGLECKNHNHSDLKKKKPIWITL